MLATLFSKVAGLRFVTLSKRPPTSVFSFENCETFKNTYFHRTLPVTASDFSGNLQIFKNFFKKILIFKSVFYELLPLKLSVTLPEIFLKEDMFY